MGVIQAEIKGQENKNLKKCKEMKTVVKIGKFKNQCYFSIDL